MSFRARVLVACLTAVLVPVTLIGFVLRRDVEERLRAQYGERMDALAGVIEEDLDRESERIAGRLAAVADRLSADSRFRAALGGDTDRSYRLDYAGGAMRLTGLSALQIHDPGGRILSSGHFRNAFDVAAPGLPRSLRSLPGGTAVARLPTAEGGMVALVRLDSVRLGGRTYRLVGGTRVGASFLSRLDRDPELAVRFVLPDDGTSRGGEAGSRTVTARPPGGAESTPGRAVTLPYLDAVHRAALPPPAAEARFEISADGATLRELRRSTAVAFGVILAGSVGLALLVALWLSARVTRPLEALAAKTGRVDLDRLDVDFSTERRDEIGQLSRMLGRMTERLRAGARDLRDAERRATLGELSRQVNHDVRNGLAPIRNVLRHLDEVARDAPARLAAVFDERRDTLAASVGYLETLAGNYERLSTRAGPGRADANAVVDEVVEAAAAGSDVEVRAEPDRSAPRVGCDPVVLRRILENLVANASDAARPVAGSVTVSVRPGDGPREPVHIVVEDTGRGMPESTRARVFDDFFTTKEEGTGLGLTVVRRLVSDAGGRVRLESEEGRGTRVTVELPADGNRRRDAAGSAARPSGAEGGGAG